MDRYERRTSISRRCYLLTGSAALVAGSAGCLGRENESDTENRNDETDDHDHSHTEEITGPVSHADVAMRTEEADHHFDPHVVWVETGGTVTWTNESGTHTTTAYHSEFDQPRRIPDAAEPWDSGMITEDGVTFEWAFEVDGVYDYFCTPHEYRAMVGTVIVGNPEPSDQPGLAEPQEELPAEAKELLERLNERVREALKHDHDH